MKVEIWSDVMCPFCYIGKRKFELALQQFTHHEKVEVEWKSYQLNPHVKTDAGKPVHQYLAERKGISIEEAKRMNEHVTNIAKEVGLIYDFDKAIVANSFDAHRLSHFAKLQGLQNKTEEALFAAYFTQGKNTADKDTLIQLGNHIGLDTEGVKEMLESDILSEEVKYDMDEAEKFGITGVPFFVFNRKYAVSGAQNSDVFLETLEKVWEDG